MMAERVGFEPTVPFGITGFQDQLLKPLGHLSELSVSNSACMILANIYRIVNSFFYFFTFFYFSVFEKPPMPHISGKKAFASLKSSGVVIFIFS